MIDTINAKDIITIKLEDSFNEESGGQYTPTYLTVEVVQ